METNAVKNMDYLLSRFLRFITILSDRPKPARRQGSCAVWFLHFHDLLAQDPAWSCSCSPLQLHPIILFPSLHHLSLEILGKGTQPSVLEKVLPFREKSCRYWLSGVPKQKQLGPCTTMVLHPFPYPLFHHGKNLIRKVTQMKKSPRILQTYSPGDH